MAKYSAALCLVSVATLLLAVQTGRAADATGNLITNGGFEAGMQIWKGDGKIVLLPEGNRVCEIDASKSRMKDIKQEFHLKQLQQVEVVFRARSIKYTGPGLRISIHQVGGGSIIWNKPLPEDGSWREYRIVYTRASANNDARELNIATLLGTGQVQVDDVEVREPSKVVEKQPPEPVVPATPAPAATPAPPAKSFPPVAIVKPPAPPIPAPSSPAKQLPPPSVPPGTFGSFEQIMNSIPVDTARKFQDNPTPDDAAKEANEYLARNVKTKPAVFRVKIDKAEVVTTGRSKFRFHAVNTPLKWNGGTILGRVWAYFPEATAPAEDQVTAGSEVTISGTLSRCDISTKGPLTLNIDFENAKIETP